ncbi:MAG: hypothetical protein O2930_10535 [Acidobacteria bacterium]|nr:hypothetical protein [Acidobacteriota bacterium]
MRMTAVVLALVLSVTAPAVAQEWELYQSLDDTFEVNFPGTPTITETTYTTVLDYVLPARVYSAERGPGRYSMTVVDYSGLGALGDARADACESGNAQCRKNNSDDIGNGYWKHDERSAMMWATSQMVRAAAEVTLLSWEWQDRVEGHALNLTNADGSRTFAYVAMHEHKLYIMKGTVPRGYPEPGLFQQSLAWIDTVGNRVRYDMIYSNMYHGMGLYPKPSYPGAAAGAAAPAGTP